ncbi:DUF1127 domain-containing protein [Agrobacterium sp. ES01]|uniref:DUF1127 domain-containing protein n=1 Tax=Agrobacterium sp. ES01 TaxID=3420714 RepID=UPI003D11111B
MTMNVRAIDYDLPKQVRPSLFASIGALVSTFRRLIENRSAVMQLSELDDAHLADIGLTRQDLNRVINTAGLLDDPSRMLANAACTSGRHIRRS